MILVDVYVPSVDKTYDFTIDQTAEIASVIEEITEMIRQKEHCDLVGNSEELMLCCRKSRMIMDKRGTLEQLGVVTGDQLLLV